MFTQQPVFNLDFDRGCVGLEACGAAGTPPSANRALAFSQTTGRHVDGALAVELVRGPAIAVDRGEMECSAALARALFAFLGVAGRPA
jgi:hypothetical protein